MRMLCEIRNNLPELIDYLKQFKDLGIKTNICKKCHHYVWKHLGKSCTHRDDLPEEHDFGEPCQCHQFEPYDETEVIL